MYTWNEAVFHTKQEEAFRLASEVDRWPELLPHYRSVKFLEGDSAKGGIVEMAAVRPFGRGLKWPVWWMSEMEIDAAESVVRYRHIRGVTKGMDVEWNLTNLGDEIIVTIVHKWNRPAIGVRAAADLIGNVFVHHIADRTLAGLKRAADKRAEVVQYG
ncbi:SRPBCC family protein [Paenibacillus sp. GCM10023252]|uniref:SRPBCC family protein n=1 Tax=Paenibacillus sp. GCM10023252 TaxID=3252649 RepID=UPI003617F86B